MHHSLPIPSPCATRHHRQALKAPRRWRVLEELLFIYLAWDGVLWMYLYSLGIGHYARDSPPTLHERHREGIFNVYQLIPEDATPISTSIWGTAHALINHPACKILGWPFIAGLRFETRLDSLEQVRIPLSHPALEWGCIALLPLKTFFNSLLNL